MCDEVEFSTPEEFGTALITLSPWKSLAGNQLLVGEGKESVRVTIATDGPAHKLRSEQIHENMPRNLVPTRLGIDLERPVAKARITLAIRLAKVFWSAAACRRFLSGLRENRVHWWVSLRSPPLRLV